MASSGGGAPRTADTDGRAPVDDQGVALQHGGATRSEAQVRGPASPAGHAQGWPHAAASSRGAQHRGSASCGSL